MYVSLARRAWPSALVSHTPDHGPHRFDEGSSGVCQRVAPRDIASSPPDLVAHSVSKLTPPAPGADLFWAESFAAWDTLSPSFTRPSSFKPAPPSFKTFKPHQRRRSTDAELQVHLPPPGFVLIAPPPGNQHHTETGISLHTKSLPAAAPALLRSLFTPAFLSPLPARTSLNSPTE
ncbi:hypothetical protein K438DRAFT_1789939 [Mycena galopus ATCC 62051]|nr:hypothetical protein K438DRAFT_1789939 [Mycena galopus ATCC 62051]